MALARLQKVLAHGGVASRRQCEVLIEAGRVRVNGQVATLGSLVDPERDRLEVDGRVVGSHQAEQPRLTVMFHKPVGVLSTCADPEGRETVLDGLPQEWQQQRLYPVGRLDANSSGALLLSNDGDLTLRLTHPRYHVHKTYWVEVLGSPTPETLAHWRQGVMLEGSPTLPAEVEVIGRPQGWRKRYDVSTWLRLVLYEGRNRQIRKVATLLGHPVLALHRVAIGSICLDDLKLGQFRLLTPAEQYTLHCESHANYDS